jgi:hypothetical protein
MHHQFQIKKPRRNDSRDGAFFIGISRRIAMGNFKVRLTMEENQRSTCL